MSPVADLTFEIFKGQDLSDDIIKEAAKLFSDHYGVWPGNGKRVRMSADHLKRMLVPEGDHNEIIYVRALREGKLAGNIFACRWNVDGRMICWITQLVVDKAFRKKGVATNMLLKLREGHPTDLSFGILSTHAAAIRAALRAFDQGLDDVDLDMIQEHASTIMAASPVSYVRDAKFHGSLFGKVEDGTISSADTSFLVDHTEPLEALETVRDQGISWPLGRLLAGHEFLLLVRGNE